MVRRDWMVTGVFVTAVIATWVGTAQAGPQQAPAAVTAPVIQAVVVRAGAGHSAGAAISVDKPHGQVIPVHPAQTVFAAGYGSVEIVSDAAIKKYCQEAATASGLGPNGWANLYAICQVESSLGQDPSISVAGAEGPMQFLPATWAEYGAGSVYDLRDSIMAAGRMLRDNGAPGNWQAAIYTYNHSRDYVRLVMQTAAGLIGPGQ